MKNALFILARIILLLLLVPLFYYYNPESILWQTISITLFMLMLTSMASGLEDFAKMPVDFTLVGDLYFLSAICILIYFTGFSHAHLLLLISVVPLLDIIRYFFCSANRPSTYLSKHTKSLALLEFIFILFLLFYLFSLGFKRASTYQMLAFIVGSITSLTAFYLTLSPKKFNLPARETRISWCYFGVPISLFVWISTGFAPFYIQIQSAIIGTLILVIIILDMVRYRYS